MEFWRLTHPNYESDYRHSYINGSLEHPFGLPGVDCEVCGQTWGGGRILPIECPLAMKTHKNLKAGWPIGVKEHKSLQQRVQEELLKQETPISELRPGDRFQPGYLDVPSIPQADFLWSSLSSVIVSQRVRHLFEEMKIQEVAFCDVTLRKVGRRNAKSHPPMPPTGEPEDIIKCVSTHSETNTIGPYYELVILAESDYPLGGKPISVCPGCGRESINNKTRKLVMQPAMWKGAEIFFLATTLHIMITDRLRQSLQKLGATNIEFKR